MIGPGVSKDTVDNKEELINKTQSSDVFEEEELVLVADNEEVKNTSSIERESVIAKPPCPLPECTPCFLATV